LNGVKSILWAGIVLGFVISNINNAHAEDPQGAMPPGHPPLNAGASGMELNLSSMGASVTGTVTETLNAANYTYVRVDAGTRSIWAAAPQFEVKVGDRVSVPTTSPMPNYHSDTLDRTFSLVYFAGSIRVFAASIRIAGPQSNPAIASDRSGPHPSTSRAAPLSEQTLVGISKAEGGRTVGEVFDQGKGLAGSEVTIRGRVVKYSPRIMGTNWLHLQDGTQGKGGSNDLVVTTDDSASVGDLVVIRGVVSADKDFGYGYKYDLIVEGANVTVE